MPLALNIRNWRNPLCAALSTFIAGALLSSCCCPQQVRTDPSRTFVPPAGTQSGSGGIEEGDSGALRLIIGGPNNPLPVIPREQEGFYSCWSTSAEMIMEFLGRRVRQCHQSSRPSDTGFWCCEAQSLNRHPDCDAPGHPDFERWGFDYEMRPQQALTWSEVQNEIDNGRPFAFSWMRSDLNTPGSQISHMLVVVGYGQSGNVSTRMLFCLNPRPFAAADELMVPFSDYVGSATGGANTTPNTAPIHYVHQSDYFRIRPATPGLHP